MRVPSERENAVYASAFPPKPAIYRPTRRERIGYRIDALRYRIARWIWPWIEDD